MKVIVNGQVFDADNTEDTITLLFDNDTDRLEIANLISNMSLCEDPCQPRAILFYKTGRDLSTEEVDNIFQQGANYIESCKQE